MTASHCNLIPPIFYFLTNLDRFSVWCLTTGGAYAPVYTVVLDHGVGVEVVEVV